ncbi:MAG TPA: type II toxin-antitoxin system RelE/ParE family toxin [Longimicrobiaceae bacterium]|nr:type II toxin-antitoxin system RelE/ParE family toxin [Longimicrobiaceae bacterium]
MRFSVLIQPPAEDDAEAAYLYIQERAPQAAEAWLDGLLAAIETLSTMPERCALAPENDAFAEEIRQLLYRSHRVLFTVRGAEVHILHIRHVAQDRLRPET